MRDEVIKAFAKDLAKLKSEVEQYSDDDKFWAVTDGINNSAGNLCLHLIGNLNHYIGAKLGKTGYVRNRPAEFSSKNVSRSEILRKIEQTIVTVRDSLGGLTDDGFQGSYPDDESDETVTVAAELVSILTHLNYHLGQINYHRRLLLAS